MDPFSALATASTVLQTLNALAETIIMIKDIHDQMKGADAQVVSVLAQLNTMKSAVEVIQQLVQTKSYDQQMEMDLELSLQATQLHMDFINAKLSRLKTKNSTGVLRLRSRLKLVWDSQDMAGVLDRLNHQATALNLLITVLNTRSLTEQKAVLQRSNTRKVFQQLKEDKATLLDETASVNVLRDDASVMAAVERTRSEPIIGKTPWKKFSFDRQVLGSKAYNGKRLRRTVSDKTPIAEETIEVGSEVVDDASTLVEEPEPQGNFYSESRASAQDADGNVVVPRFSTMLAISHPEHDMDDLVAEAQSLWNAPAAENVSSLARNRNARVYRLSTRFFEVNIHAHTIDRYSANGISSDLLTSYKDVASILFAVSVSVYQRDFDQLQNDLDLFGIIANDYHLWLAKIILYLDTSDLSSYGGRMPTSEIRSRFLQAARGGASHDRVRVVVGPTSEVAGTIFAVSNENGRTPENKWGGLSKWATE